MNPSEALYQENQELRRRLRELEADLITAQAIALEERERCAMIAEDYAGAATSYKKHEAALEILAKIREGTVE